MADIKFMDISENDNPATTDSILVGNKDNGLKRTTLGKLGDMFSVHGLLHLEDVKTILKADTISYAIAAPVVDGYSFAFWLSCVPTTGFDGAAYVSAPTLPNVNMYIAYPKQGGELNSYANGVNSLHAYAVYVKNSLV